MANDSVPFRTFDKSASKLKKNISTSGEGKKIAGYEGNKGAIGPAKKDLRGAMKRRLAKSGE